MSVGDDGKVLLRPLSGGVLGEANLLAQFDDVVWGVRFSPDGSRVATAAEDGSVRLFDITPGAPMRVPLIEKGSAFFSVAFSPDGKGLVAGDFDGDVFGWRVPDGSLLFDPVRGAHASHIWKLAFDANGSAFATSSSDGKSVLFSYPGGAEIGPNATDGGLSSGVGFSSDGSTVLGGNADGGLWVRNIWSSGPIAKLQKATMHQSPT